jgi:type II secretory pathway pseudopilin PulG
VSAESSREAGYSLVALMAGLTIMLILMGVATPAWRYVMQDMREEELIFRGSQIAEAIERYQKKNGNTYPPSMEILVKGKYLRKDFKDPMVPSGKWRFLRPGEVPTPGRAAGPGGPTRNLGPGLSPSPAMPNLPGTDPTVAGTIGPIAGVVSTSKLKGYRKFNNRENYNEWAFIAGQPRFVGDMPMPGAPPPGGAPGGPRPSGMPVPPSGPPQSPGAGMPMPPPQGDDRPQ